MLRLRRNPWLLALALVAITPAAAGPTYTPPPGGSVSGLTDAANVAITGGSITGITDLAVADGGTGASTASAARTNLGLTDASVIEQWVVLPGNVSNSSNVNPVLATDMTFTPDASDTYAIRVVCAFTTAATTTGIVWGIRDHATAADGSGAGYFQARGTSATAGTVSIPSIVTGGAGTDAPGTGSGSGETMIRGEAIWTADASPTAVGVYFLSEIDTSQVTALGGKCAMVYRKIKDN